MPRLQILQHKSYHPYLEPNKQRVREDEARAAAIEAEEDSKLLNASSEARLDLLRRRQDDPSAIASSSTSSSLMPSEPSKLLTAHRRDLEKKISEKRDKKGPEFDWPAKEKARAEKRALKGQGKGKGREGDEGKGPLGMDGEIRFEEGKHINFWSGLEAEKNSDSAVALKSKAKTEAKPTPDDIQDDDPTTMYLKRPERETKPWYTDSELRRYEERGGGSDEVQRKRERKRYNDERNKSAQDPFSQVKTALSFTAPAPVQPHNQIPMYSRPSPVSSSITDPLLVSRLKREDSERSRALALIQEAKRKAARELTQTPSTVANGDDYGDQWNAREVREAKQRREAVRGWSKNVAGERRGESNWDDRFEGSSRRRETRSIDRGHRRTPPRRSWEN